MAVLQSAPSFDENRFVSWCVAQSHLQVLLDIPMGTGQRGLQLMWSAASGNDGLFPGPFLMAVLDKHFIQDGTTTWHAIATAVSL